MCETRDLVIKWPQWHTLTFPTRRGEDALCTGEINLLEGVGSEARV